MWAPQSFLWCDLALIELALEQEEVTAGAGVGSSNVQEKPFFPGLWFPACA